MNERWAWKGPSSAKDGAKFSPSGGYFVNFFPWNYPASILWPQVLPGPQLAYAYAPRRLLRVSCVARRSSQSWIFIGRTEAETPILWPPEVKSRLIRKNPDAGKDWRQEEKGATENEMVRWHHWFNWHEFEQTLGDSEGQGRLECCGPWGHKVGHDLVNEQQNMNNIQTRMKKWIKNAKTFYMWK